MNGYNFPRGYRELVIGLVVEVIVGVFMYLLTLNILITVVAVLITVIALISIAFLYKVAILLKRSGLRRIYKDSPDPTPLLRKYFGKSRRIRLLAIRGARMLGTDRSLINYVIKKLPKGWYGSIQVLLLDPNSPYLRERAVELGHDPSQFATECRGSIQNISNLKDKFHVDIEVRVYDRKPVVRTIIFDDRALLSYYIGEEGHIPFQYEVRRSENSLFRMVNLIYDNLWEESNPAEEPAAGAGG